MVTAGRLAGRTHEVGLLHRFLDDLPLGPRALILEGEVGIGVSTAMDAGEIASSNNRPNRGRSMIDGYLED